MSFYTLFSGLPLDLIRLIGVTLELFTEFFTASDRDGSRASHSGPFRKAFKVAWKPVLTKASYVEAEALISELVKDPAKKVTPLSSLFLSWFSFSFWYFLVFHNTFTAQETPVRPPRTSTPYVLPGYAPAPAATPAPAPTSALPPKAYAGKAPCAHCGQDPLLFLFPYSFNLVFFLMVWVVI